MQLANALVFRVIIKPTQREKIISLSFTHREKHI